MSNYFQQFLRVKRLLVAILTIFGYATAAQAGEVAIELSDNGADIREDTTEDRDSRSDEVTGTAEGMLDVVDTHDSAVPLADAVTAADGSAEVLRILGAEIPPGDTQRLSWSATELFEGVPVATPVLVVNGALPGPTLSGF